MDGTTFPVALSEPDILDRLRDQRMIAGEFAVPSDTTKAEWTEMWYRAGRLNTRAVWTLCVLWEHAEDHHYGDLKAWCAKIGICPKTLSNQLSVFRSLGGSANSRRREDVSYANHAIIAAFEPDKQIAELAWAAEHKPTKRQFQKHLKDRTTNHPPVEEVETVEEPEPPKNQGTRIWESLVDRLGWNQDEIVEVQDAMPYLKEIPAELRDKAHRVFTFTGQFASSFAEEVKPKSR